MSIFTKGTVTIGDEKKTIIRMEVPQDKKVSVDQQIYHHVLIFDRSGSMHWFIRDLIDNAKEAIKHISDKDFLSVVWFSGPGEFKTVIKGAKKSDNLEALLDSLKSTLSTTCFSDAFKEVETIINDLALMCPNFNVVLFTDGAPVVPWGEREEILRLRAILERIEANLFSMVTIGYGNYYNPQMLCDIVTHGKQGNFFHSTDVEQYCNYFRDTYSKLSALTTRTIDIGKILLHTVNMYIHKSGDTFQGYTVGKPISLAEKDNVIYFIGNEYHIDYDHQTYGNKSKDTMTQEHIDEALYMYAHELYKIGLRDKCQDVIATLQDKRLYIKQQSAFTVEETGKFKEELNRAALKPDYRLQDGKADLKAMGSLPCVMDIFKVLVKGDNYYLPSSVKNYERIGKKQEVEVTYFKPNDEENLSPLSDLTFNETKINMSVKYQIPGSVFINPAQADKLSLPHVMNDLKRFKTHTFIKDGNLNIKEFTVEVDPRTYRKLNDLNNMFSVKDRFAQPHVGDRRVDIDLSHMSVINRKLKQEIDNMSTEYVHATVANIAELEVDQKVLNYLIKKTKEESKVAQKVGLFASYNVKQIEVLKAHGIGEDGTYHDPFPKKTVESVDYYEARTLSFEIEGKKSIPSVDSVLKAHKAGKGLKGRNADVFESYCTITANMTKAGFDVEKPGKKVYQYLQEQVKDVREQLKYLRMEVAQIKMVKILSNSWFTELEDGEKDTYTHKYAGTTMVVKATKEKVWF